MLPCETAKNCFMIPASTPGNMTDYSQYAIWLIAIALVAFGFRYAKGIIALVLDKFYEFFIQDNPVHL